MVARKSRLRALLDLIFPSRCYGCKQRGVWLCPECIAKLVPLPPPFCRYCGRPTGGVLTCPDCWHRRPDLDGVHSAYYFEEALRSAIHQFKYRRAAHLAIPLASLLVEQLAPKLPAADVLVPVPLHPRRLRRRGYNQSALLSTALSNQLGLPVIDDALRRHRDTPPQMGLPAAERRRNVHGAFGCADNRLRGCRVLLVDDVCTTTATLDACASALKKCGAKTVRGLTLARAR